MKVRHLLWTLSVLGICLGVIGVFAMFGTYSVHLTEAQIQERIDAKKGESFPINGAAKLLLSSIMLNDAHVSLANGKVNLQLDVSGALRLGHKEFQLAATTEGIPLYQSGAFYFRPDAVSVTHFAYNGSTPAESLTRFADRYVDGDKAAQFIRDKAPNMEAWVTEVAQGAAITTLNHKPVYRVKDDVKGFVIRAALQSVKVDGKELVVTFSLMQLTATILLSLLALIMAFAMMIVLAENPLLGALVLLS